MEAIITIGTVLAGLGVFAALAMVFGADSRPGFEDYANRTFGR